jgi:hypothetical protein
MARFHTTILLRGTPEYDALKRETERSLLEAKEQIERITAACDRLKGTPEYTGVPSTSPFLGAVLRLLDEACDIPLEPKGSGGRAGNRIPGHH